MTSASIRVVSAFAKQAAKHPRGLCTAAVDALGVAGAGITVMTGASAGVVCTSDDRSQLLDDIQFSLGEGPCADAFADRAPVLAPQFDALTAERWPAFVGQAVRSGVGSVFAYPVMDTSFDVGVSVGVLTVYNNLPGPLSLDQHHDAQVVATVLFGVLLDHFSSAGDQIIDDIAAHRAEVHQATGMVAAQLDLPASDALARIRAYAFVHDQTVMAVAAEIVARRLRLEPDSTESGDER